MTRFSMSIVLLSCLLSTPASAGRAMGKADLERQLLVYLNDRLYGSCRAVILAPPIRDVYYGFVDFINGQRTDLKVNVSDEKIEYAFLKPASSRTGPQPENEVLLSELQAIIEQQRAEIARLERLCTANGIDPRPSPSHPTSPTPDGTATPALTPEMYNRITKDMSREQVVEILGSPGSEISSSHFDDALNEVRVWSNPDDSFICIVFRDNKVLVKTQSGLNRIASEPQEQPQEFAYFDMWLLAQRIDGRIVPLDLSFGQWLRKVYSVSPAPSAESAMSIIEEDSRIIVELPPRIREDHPNITALTLTCLPPEGRDDGTPPAERICIPSGIRTGTEEKYDPAQAWKIMAALAGLPED